MSHSRSISRRLRTLAALLAFPSMALAQTGTVRGSVVDSASQRGIPGVLLAVGGTTRNAVTDGAGRFTIRNVPLTSTTVRAQRIGYAAQDRSLTFTGDTASVTIVMRPIAVQLSEVVSIGYGTSSRLDINNAVASV